MSIPSISLIYFIFFLSGASALIYEIVWVRYLSLVFGGSHLAVTTVLTVFMTGLALGSYVIGTRIDRHRQLLRLFGCLELGIGISAIFFAGLMKIYPPVYIKLAQIAPESLLYLSFVRIAFAVAALIVPTTLMGGTLPVLTAFTSRLMKGAGVRLSFLYGCNTIGAVSGAAATGFVMLRNFSMGKTLLTAMALNVIVGVSALLLQRKTAATPPCAPEAAAAGGDPPLATGNLLPYRLVLWGIGISGFCAMAYEVLWGRILSVAIGASAYGFTLLLMAFLTGIGAGSTAYGLFCRIAGALRHKPAASPGRSIAFFGAVQIAIGATALLATSQFRYLPAYTAFLHDRFLSLFPGGDQFQVIQLANFVLAFSVMFVPAFFMGIAFPLAGAIHCRYRQIVGRAVGELLSANTIGAILGAAVSGYLLIYLFGIQRSLQIIIICNIGYGLVVLASVTSRRKLPLVAALAALSALTVPLFFPTIWTLWEPKLYAIYQSNKPEEYGSAEDLREMLANMDVRFYAEGTQSIVSAVQSADTLFFITNGRVEASNAHQDMQCQYVLGHLPMLLHKNPRKVFVLGTGSGMTLGAVSVHPSVEQITLAEIEPNVLGVARTFGIDNHYILNKPDPRLKVVFNDGRNYLLTTKDRFDVITADPVHPWFSGAGYLYSTEYFRLAAQRLNPGGIICQWLPLYELTAENLRSVVRTIGANFAYTMIWVTNYDAEIIASNSPLIIDEQSLEQRIANQQILGDLRQIKMGSAENFLSFFLMGTEGATAYSKGGIINTDDNLYLEFSAPRSIGQTELRAANLADLLGHREKINRYLRPAEGAARTGQQQKWEANYQAALLEDKAHILSMAGQHLTYQYTEIATELENRYPRYAPWRFQKDESGDERGGKPEILKEVELPLLDENGAGVRAQFTAILLRKNSKSARVFFVDDNSRTVFGKLRVKGSGKEAYIEKFVSGIETEVRAIYTAEAAKAVAEGKTAPSLLSVFPQIKTVVEMRIDQE
jgi:spermidine synthase